MIDKTLNKAETIELFEKEAVLFGTNDAIPFYCVVDLFGEEAAAFFDRTINFGGFLEGGSDWNAWGACTDERPITFYLYSAGFLKMVTEHNYLHVIKAHKKSESGHILDKYWEECKRRIEEADAEEEQKQAERKNENVPLLRSQEQIRKSWYE